MLKRTLLNQDLALAAGGVLRAKRLDADARSRGGPFGGRCPCATCPVFPEGRASSRCVPVMPGVGPSSFSRRPPRHGST